jgi:hypothetical protein
MIATIYLVRSHLGMVMKIYRLWSSNKEAHLIIVSMFFLWLRIATFLMYYDLMQARICKKVMIIN